MTGNNVRKWMENPLPQLTERERIYFDVPYAKRGFARSCHCSFDREEKLWFTGCLKRWLPILIRTFEVNEKTSKSARELFDLTLSITDRDELEAKVRAYYEAKEEKQAEVKVDDHHQTDGRAKQQPHEAFAKLHQ